MISPGDIEFVIRCAQQSVPDQRVVCPEMWNVLQLKELLQETTGYHPAPNQQRLIYAGQLLSDGHVLGQIIRRFGKEYHRVIHLVHTPTVSYPSLKDTASSDLRRRVVNLPQRNGAATIPSNVQQVPASPPPVAGFLPVNGLPNLMNDAGLMQQAYAYNLQLANYMSFLQQAYGPVYAGYYPFHPFGAAANQVQPNANVSSASVSVAGVPHAGSDAVLETTQPLPEQPQPEAAVRDVPIVDDQPRQAMNAQGGVEEEDPRDRDWLDWVYTASRLGFLVMILYFYSSIERFLVVIVCFILFYAYQGGWFARRNDAANHNNNNNAPQVLNLQAQPAENVNAPEAARGAEENLQNRPTNDGVDGEAQAGLQPGEVFVDPMAMPPAVELSAWRVFWSTCYTFVTSFFLSLVPQRPPPI